MNWISALSKNLAKLLSGQKRLSHRINLHSVTDQRTMALLRFLCDIETTDIDLHSLLAIADCPKVCLQSWHGRWRKKYKEWKWTIWQQVDTSRTSGMMNKLSEHRKFSSLQKVQSTTMQSTEELLNLICRVKWNIAQKEIKQMVTTYQLDSDSIRLKEHEAKHRTFFAHGKNRLWLPSSPYTSQEKTKGRSRPF